jgi:hypothetical protein
MRKMLCSETKTKNEVDIEGEHAGRYGTSVTNQSRGQDNIDNREMPLNNKTILIDLSPNTLVPFLLTYSRW